MSDTRQARPMTRAEAWRAIARKLETKRHVEAGLCWEIIRWFNIPYPTSRMMLAQIAAVLPHADDVWAYPKGREWKARAMAAYWFALDAEAEDGP